MLIELKKECHYIKCYEGREQRSRVSDYQIIRVSEEQIIRVSEKQSIRRTELIMIIRRVN